MKTVTTTTGVELVFFTKANEITAKRWNRFNTESLKSSELGNDFMSAVSKLDAMNNHLKYGNNQAWKAENENLRLQLFASYNGINVPAKAVAYLLHKINGEVYDPFSVDEELLEEEMENTGITQADVEELIIDIRKK